MIDMVARHLDSVDGVFFDFGGVVVHAPTASGWCVLDYCERQGIDRAFALAEISRMRRATDGGEMALEECYRIIAKGAGVNVEPGFAKKATELDCATWTNLADETFELMKELKAAGKKIGILSNMSRDFFSTQYCRVAAHIRAICDAEIISGIIRITKPDPRIFAFASEKIGIAPDRLLFLDDIQGNVEAARRCGWRAERYSLDADAALR